MVPRLQDFFATGFDPIPSAVLILSVHGGASLRWMRPQNSKNAMRGSGNLQGRIASTHPPEVNGLILVNAVDQELLRPE